MVEMASRQKNYLCFVILQCLFLILLLCKNGIFAYKNKYYNISTLCTQEINFHVYKKVDGAVLTSEGEDNLQCVITFQTDTLRQRFMLRFERLNLDCNDHLYIFDAAHAYGSYKADLSCHSTRVDVGTIFAQSYFLTLKYVTDKKTQAGNGFKLIITSLIDMAYGCPQSQYFLCLNSFCIHKDLTCDGVNHCEDNSDETSHASCVVSVPHSPTAVALSSTSILVKWKPPDFIKEPIINYKLYYLETGSPEERQVLTNTTSYEMRNLKKYTNYTFCVAAVNRNEVGSNTEKVTVRTYADVPSETPQSVTLEPASSTSIVIRWDPPPKKYQNGIIIGYKIRYKLRNKKQGQILTIDGSRRSFKFTDLKKGGQYKVKIAALSVNGTGPYTDWKYVTTYFNDQCGNNTCRPDQFQCKNLHCIPGQLQCNGMNECPDGSDEEDCIVHQVECHAETEFDCGNNRCISLNLVCDNKNDCGEFQDEPHLCYIDECKENNGGCSEICHNLPVGYECQCPPGYVLADNRTCQDIDECEIPGSCSQICHNTKGAYNCECMDGYMLESNNNKRCRAKEGHTVVLFTNMRDIKKINLETSEYVDILNNLNRSVALDYDYRTGIVYWYDALGEEMKSVPIDTGAPVTSVISSGLSRVDHITVDWIYGNIYWTDASQHKIQLSDKTGKMRKTIVSSDLSAPRAIVVNPLEGWLYWTDWGDPAKIERAGMDGSHRSVVVSTDVKWPNGLALDLVAKKIYWADAKLYTLSCADYDGSNRRVILSSPLVLKHPFSVDVFEDWIYWSDLESESIHRVNKFNGEEKSDIVTNIHSPLGIHVYHPYKQPNGKNYCSNMNGQCSHLCLPTPYITKRSPRYTCACPDGMKLTANGVTCVLESVSGSC